MHVCIQHTCAHQLFDCKKLVVSSLYCLIFLAWIIYNLLINLFLWVRKIIRYFILLEARKWYETTTATTFYSTTIHSSIVHCTAVTKKAPLHIIYQVMYNGCYPYSRTFINIHHSVLIIRAPYLICIVRYWKFTSMTQ